MQRISQKRTAGVIRGGVLIASVGSGKGGDLGRQPRDAHCQSLTATVRAGARTGVSEHAGRPGAQAENACH